RDHAQDVREFAVCGFVLEVADDDIGEVLHEISCRPPRKRIMAGWFSSSIMRPEKVALIRASRVCFGHFGSGKASSLRAYWVSYLSTPSAFRDVTCTHRVLACSQARRLLAFQSLSKF